MKYRNKKTGFILNTECECKGEEWECLTPHPTIEPKVEEEKPKKRTKK